jgi:hypothetical protein
VDGRAVPSHLFDELVEFLLLALSYSSSQPTTARMIGNVRVSVIKMFNLPSDTAGTRVGISIHTMKSLVHVSYRLSLFHKKFNDSTLT